MVDAKDKTKKILYKSNVINPYDSPVNNVCLLLFNNHYYTVTLFWGGMAKMIIVLNVKYVVIVSTLVNQLEYVVNVQRKTVCPSPQCFGACRKRRCFRNHLSNGVCHVTIQSHVTHVASVSSVQCLTMYAIYHITVIVQNLSNQVPSVLLK